MASVSGLRANLSWSRQNMDQNYIEVRAVTLRELFSGSYVFHLPWFQRAYAWQTDQVSRLVSDLFAALDSKGDAAEYFLGTLLICKPNASTQTSLIDGHQRTMTLTILFSVLRDLCQNPKQSQELGQFVRTTDFHLQPQDTQADFCMKYVQNEGATSVEPEELFESLSFTEQNIITSRDCIRERLSTSDISDSFRSDLATFLADRCHVIVHQAAQEEEAWARLRKEEETRLEFSNVDLAKDSLLSIMPAEQRDSCALWWEQAEGLIGDKDLYGLLFHLRSLISRKSRNKPLEEEIAEAFKLNESGLGFMRDVLLPSAHHVRALRTGAVGPAYDRSRINQLCGYMSWIDPRGWLPPALTWIKERGLDHPETKMFFEALERVFWMINMTPDSAEKLPTRMLQIADQIVKGTSIENIEALKVERKLKQKALEKLRAQYFDRRALRVELMRRIAVADGQDPGPIDGESVTVEHILPRGWKIQNSWREAFPDRAHVVAHAHCLGNLTYLTRADNAVADSQEFEAKKRIYTECDFKMTKDVAEQTTWVQDDIEARTERLIAGLFKDWGLPLT